jgi:hypothetical protein
MSQAPSLYIPFSGPTESGAPLQPVNVTGGSNLSTSNWVQDISKLIQSGTGLATALLGGVNQLSNVSTTNVAKNPVTTDYSKWLIGGGIALASIVGLYFIIRKK